jgi:hypothetical protein
MSSREKGLRRTAAVTLGITAASVVGTAALAGAAWAETSQQTGSGTAAPSSTSPSAQSTAPAPDDPGTSSGSVSSTDGAPHATSGGS